MPKTYEPLEVTNVQVFPLMNDSGLGHLKGRAIIVLNDQFLVRGLRIVEGENGLFVGYAHDPLCNDDFRSISNPLTRQLREHIEDVVLAKYQEAVAND